MRQPPGRQARPVAIEDKAREGRCRELFLEPPACFGVRAWAGKLFCKILQARIMADHRQTTARRLDQTNLAQNIGRRSLVMAGRWTEVCVAQTALSAISDGCLVWRGMAERIVGHAT